MGFSIHNGGERERAMLVSPPRGVLRRVFLLLSLVIVAALLGAAYGRAEIPQRGELLDREADGVRVHRIVVVGDIHGDPEKFKAVLLRAQVVQLSEEVDGEGEAVLALSSGPVDGVVPHRTTLIQMGDLIDRGHDDRGALNLALDLHEQVKGEEGGAFEVVLLLGNHELMNLQRHYRYVHRDGYGGFLNKALRNAAFDVNGPYGKFIVEHFKMIHMDEGTLFVHAGITSSYLSDYQSEEEFNERARQDLRTGNFRSPLLNSYGPVWTRQTVFDAKSGDCTDLERVLKLLRVDRMVVGHTPERGGHMGVYCEGRLIAVDVGLSKWMYDGFAALEIVVKERADPVDGGSQKKEVTLWELNAQGRALLWPKEAEESYGDTVDPEDL